MVLFVDRNLGKAFPRILEEAGLAVELHDDHFPPTTLDEDWLPEVGKRGWVVVTRDQRIRYKPNELEAVQAHRLSVLVLIGDAPFPELARNFVATRRRIERFMTKAKPPFIAKVYRPTKGAGAGRVEKWYS